MLNAKYLDMLEEFNQDAEEFNQKMELVDRCTAVLSNLEKCNSFAGLQFVMSDMPVYPLCTFENLTQYPLSTAIEMCREGFGDSISQIFKNIWEWIKNICKKIGKFIKSFFSSDNKTLEDKISAYLGNITDMPIGDKLTVEFMAYNYEVIHKRMSILNSLFRVWLLQWGPISPVYDVADPNQLPSLNSIQMFKSLELHLKSLNSKDNISLVGERLVPVRLQFIRYPNLWNTSWGDIADIGNIRTEYDDLMTLTKGYEFSEAALANLKTKWTPLVNPNNADKIRLSLSVLGKSIQIILALVQMSAQVTVDLGTCIDSAIGAYNRAQEKVAAKYKS